MSDKPRTDTQGSAYQSDDDRQRQQPGGTTPHDDTAQHGHDQGSRTAATKGKVR